MCIRDSDHAPDSRAHPREARHRLHRGRSAGIGQGQARAVPCLLYTSDAADERSSVDLGGRRIIKQKTKHHIPHHQQLQNRQHFTPQQI